MYTSIGTHAGSPDRPNEDWVTATPTTAIVLDGVTPPATSGHGCHHSVPWFVRSLGTWFLALLETGDGDMASALGDAIDQVADLHSDTCDLGHPGTPAATVGAIRQRGDSLEWLVLADTTVVIDTTTNVRVISDSRVDQAVPEARARVLQQRIGSAGQRAAMAHMTREQLKRRNVPGGYWVAAASRQAASEAITGSIAMDQVKRVALFSDGAASLFPRHPEAGDGDWRSSLDGLERDGIEESLYWGVRRWENRDPEGVRHPRYKKSDDATVALARACAMTHAELDEWSKEPIADGEFR